MSNEETKGELVEYHGGCEVALPADPFSNVPGLYCSWDVSKPGGIDRMSKALRQADLSTDDVLDEVLMVQHVLVHIVDLKGEEAGEVVKAIRTVFILDTGATAGFVSRGIYESLPILGRTYGAPPWEPARKVRVFRQKTRGKFHILKAEPVE